MEKAGVRLRDAGGDPIHCQLGFAATSRPGGRARRSVRNSWRRGRQVGGHDLGRAPVEGERRDHQPAVPHRHQVGFARGVLLFQQGDRVRAVCGRVPPRVARRRHRIPSSKPLAWRSSMLGCAICVMAIRTTSRSDRALSASARPRPALGRSGHRAEDHDCEAAAAAVAKAGDLCVARGFTAAALTVR